MGDHNDYQEAVFDEHAEMFAKLDATPEALVPRMRRVARACALSPELSVLDVATGTGALLPFFEAEGLPLAQVTGVDLSARMLGFARVRFPAATFVHSDILKFQGADGRRYDRVVYNACFGNFENQVAVLQHTANKLMQPGGLLVISHPLGRRWLEGLRERDPRMVVSELPTAATLQQLSEQRELPLTLESLEDEDDFYCATLRRRLDT